MTDDRVAVRVLVGGHVQGVFFRDSCRQEALTRGVAGWVRNNADGRVEAMFQGPREMVEGMVEWMRRGPPHAAVDSVEVSPVESSPSEASAPAAAGPAGERSTGFQIR